MFRAHVTLISDMTGVPGRPLEVDAENKFPHGHNKGIIIKNKKGKKSLPKSFQQRVKHNV